jgi:hypothetical protein
MPPRPTKTGLPQLDRASWEKGFSDGFRGHVWWPGPGTEPLSYAAGYTEAQADRGATAESVTDRAVSGEARKEGNGLAANPANRIGAR